MASQELVEEHCDLAYRYYEALSPGSYTGAREREAALWATTHTDRDVRMRNGALRSGTGSVDTGGSGPNPMQPVVLARDGVARFKSNAIIEHLFATGQLDLNDLSLIPFSDEDRAQVMQLLGYSVSGFADLTCAHGDQVATAHAEAEELAR